jgi:hypothetical protein
MKPPAPEEIRAERERAGWSPATAAAAVLVTERAWRQWEAGKRQMTPGLWILFTLLVGRRVLTYDRAEGQRAVLRLAIETPPGGVDVPARQV